MNSDRWQHVQDLFFNAIEMQPEQRHAFIEEQCGRDPEVWKEVGSLLDCEERIGNFLNGTAVEVLTNAYERRPAERNTACDLIGTIIADRYVISDFVGSGGMGTVYRANHQLLGVPVAIKRIAGQFRGRDEYRERFLEEARKAARLDHENITKVTDAVDERGEVFVVMEFVEGQTLRTRLQSPVSLEEFFQIAIQCASGLIAAHRQRIVHLDLKPENIMLTTSNKVKICDFGVARQFSPDDNDDPQTPAGHWTFAGTPAYMAPEVMDSNRFDQRADFFSLGLVFYELLAGKHPFLTDDVKSTTNRIKNEAAAPLPAEKKLPRSLIRLVGKMLAKDPRERPKSADDILRELQSIRRHSTLLEDAWSALRALAMEAARKPIAAVAIALAGLTASGSLIWSAWMMDGFIHSQQAATQMELAVLPFKNVGDDPANQAFCDGVVETLTNKLSELDQFQNVFRVKAASEIRGISSARDAHRIFGVAYVITGSVQRFGDSVQLTLSLVDAKTGTLVHGTTKNADVANLSTIQNDLAIDLAKMLLGSPISKQARELFSRGTTDTPVAYDSYVQGIGYLQHYENAQSIDKAINLFNQALQLDAKYALAHAGLGEAYWRKYELTKETRFADLAKDNCQNALALSDRLAQVHVTLALISNGTGRYEDAVEQANKSLAINPANGAAYQEIAHAYEKMGKLVQAEDAYRYATRARTNDWGSYNSLGRFYAQRGRYTEAEPQFLKAVELAPDNVRLYNNLGAIYQQTKRFGDAETMLKKSLEIRPNAPGYSNLGTLYYFHLQRPSDAARMFEKAVAINERDFRAWRNLAAAYYWTPNERPKAQAAYEKTIELVQQDLQVNERDQALLMHLADSYAMIDQPGRALDYLKKAMDIAALDNNAMLLAAGIYERLGQRALAVEWITKALCSDYPRDSFDSDPSFVELRTDPSFQAATNPTVLTTKRRETKCL